MKITRVHGKDFLSLGEVDFALNDKGLLHLHGVNADDSAAKSNGAGKSSLLDMLMWTLYGTTARDVQGDDVIREGSKGAVGSVTFEDGGQSYQVMRGRKKGNEKLVFDCGPVSLTKGTIKLTQAEIVRVLGCTEEVFRGSIYAGQEQLVDLPLMTDKMLKLTIENAAGIDVLEKAYEVARTKMKVRQAEVEAADTTISLAKIKIAGVELCALNERDAAATCLSVWKGRVEKADDEVTKKESLVVSVTALVAGMRPLIVVQDLLNKFDGAMASIATEANERALLTGAHNKAEWALSAGASKLRDAQFKVHKSEAHRDDLHARVGTPCHECGTEMTHDHIKVAHAAAEGRICDAVGEVEDASEALEALTAARDAAAKELADYSATMRDPAATLAKRKIIQDELNAVQHAADSLLNCSDNLLLVKGYRAALDTEVNPHTARQEMFERELVDLKIHLTKLQDFQVDRVEVLHVATTAALVFSPSGVRAHILDQVTPFLNVRTAEYLSALTDGVITAVWSTLTPDSKGELKEKFSIDVKHEKGERGFRSLSGGEKRKVRIACVLALQDLVKSRATKPIDLFIADEVDTALDSAGLERLMVVFQERAKTSGTVVVISHNDLRDYIPNVWTITKKDGVSELAL
ncbi:MAG: AAA family ATPase [Janthinobacterium lividum]